MEIIRTNINTGDKKALYKLTKSSSQSVQDAPDGVSVEIKTWALYTDPKEQRDGSVKDQTVLSFTDGAGTKYSTISATFIRDFLGIVDIMEDEPFAIILVHGLTKGGKKFVTCELDCDF